MYDEEPGRNSNTEIWYETQMQIVSIRDLLKQHNRRVDQRKS